MPDSFLGFLKSWHGVDFGLKTFRPGNEAHCTSRCLSLEMKVFGLSLFLLFKLPGTYFAQREVLQSKDIYFPSGEWWKIVPLRVTCLCDEGSHERLPIGSPHQDSPHPPGVTA